MSKNHYTTNDPELASEWREHNRRRNVRRDPRLPQFDATAFKPAEMPDEYWLERGYVKVAVPGGRGYHWEQPRTIVAVDMHGEADTGDGDKAAKNIYNRARETIESKPSWTAGESVTIWQEGGCRAYIVEGGRDGGLMLSLIFANGKPGKEVRVTAGLLNPLTGWQFTLKENQYRVWVAQARKLVTIERWGRG